LNERFASARTELTTSIGEAAKLANISPEKARYAEAIGILSPGRSQVNTVNKGSPHRRYSLGELNRLIVMGDLIDHGFSMSDIAHYLNRERNNADIILDSIQAPDIATRLREAETSYIQRMLIPRLLYFTQCLLLGDVVDCSIALVLPVETDESALLANIPVTQADDLPLVGPSLVGWHSRSHPYCVFYMREPRMDDSTRYELRPVDEMCREAGVADVDTQPTGAYLLIERGFAHLLHASSTARVRPETESPHGDAEKKHPNPRAVAHRLLRFLRTPGDEGNQTFGHRYSTFGDGMVYSSPEFMSDMTGDTLLMEIAELVVRLGNAVKTDKSSRRGSWIFSAILRPDNPSLPPGRQSLVVTAQSKMSPHILGVTRLTPGKNEGLSSLAALSGHLLLRRAMESTDAAIADAGFEGEPGPALALPVLGSFGRVMAVLYIRSKYEGDTSTHETFTFDDQLLLRVIGHTIGGIVAGYRGNYLARNVLAGMIEQPRNVDRFLQEFKSANAFWVDLETALKGQIDILATSKETRDGAAENSRTNPITLLAIDIDGHSNIFNEYGHNTARSLIRALGRRIAGQPLLTSSSLMGASSHTRNNLYHIYGDRFCLLLENISRQDAESYAINLRDMLSGNYTLEISRASDGQTASASSFRLHNVSVRIALISYDRSTLRKLLAPVTPASPATHSHAHEPVQYVISVIMNALDAGLNQGKQTGPGSVTNLDTATGFFRQLSSANDSPGATRTPGAQSRRSTENPTSGNTRAHDYRSNDEWE
jgi:DNA-binding transcriptional MerR regulator/GGDEF domain-containing protein